MELEIPSDNWILDRKVHGSCQCGNENVDLHRSAVFNLYYILCIYFNMYIQVKQLLHTSTSLHINDQTCFMKVIYCLNS
jgi:hypothetical protein